MATILIVDDSPTEQHILKHILAQAGHETLSAYTGIDGIALAESHRPDVILMDVVMPGMNGYEATRKLSKSDATKHIPVVIVTTRNSDTDAVWGLRQGAHAYIAKPTDQKKLLKAVDDALLDASFHYLNADDAGHRPTPS